MTMIRPEDYWVWKVQSGREVKNGAKKNVADRCVNKRESWVPKPNLKTVTVTFVHRSAGELFFFTT